MLCLSVTRRVLVSLECDASSTSTRLALSPTTPIYPLTTPSMYVKIRSYEQRSGVPTRLMRRLLPDSVGGTPPPQQSLTRNAQPFLLRISQSLTMCSDGEWM